MLVTSIRILASLLFAVVVCVSFLAFLTASKVRTTLLEPSFYTQVLEENDSYEIIQIGLISNIGDSEEVGGLRNDLGMDDHEFDNVAKDVISLPYLKTQLDGIITGVMSYLRGEVEEPQLFVELAQPIQSIRQASLDFVDRRIESVEQTNPTTPEEYAQEAQTLIEYLESGQIPPSAPSLANVPTPVLENALDQVLPTLSFLDPRIAASLEAQWEEVRTEALNQPDSPEAMKLAARAVVSPYIDEAITEVRTHLDDRDRFDLVEAAAEASELTRQEFVEGADAVRDPINTLHSVGPTVALVIMALATVFLVLVNIPHRTAMIMWPGITLILTGVVAIIVSALLSAFIPEASSEICDDAADFVCEPTLDILLELSRALGNFPLLPSVALIVIGSLGSAAAILMSMDAVSSSGPRPPSSMADNKPKEGW